VQHRRNGLVFATAAELADSLEVLMFADLFVGFDEHSLHHPWPLFSAPRSLPQLLLTGFPADTPLLAGLRDAVLARRSRTWNVNWAAIARPVFALCHDRA
jgi:hypothetical protein